MGLVGLLEEIGLVDVLQLLGQAQKTGVLRLGVEGSAGWIEVRGGLVCGASLHGGPREFRSLLVGGGVVAAPTFEAAEVQARGENRGVLEVLEETGGPSAAEVERLARGAVESAVFEMLRWMRGDFRFDLGEADGAEPLLPAGLSIPYLLMEGARRVDERGAGQAPLVDATNSARPSQVPGPVIAINEDLAVLDWLQTALADRCERLHVFQRSELGLARIRQYLARARAPLVLISPEMPVDRLSGITDAADFARRLQAQTPGLRVIWLLKEPGARPPVACAGDGAIVGPDLADPSPGVTESRAEALYALASEVVGNREGSSVGTPSKRSRAPEQPEPVAG